MARGTLWCRLVIRIRLPSIRARGISRSSTLIRLAALLAVRARRFLRAFRGRGRLQVAFPTRSLPSPRQALLLAEHRSWHRRLVVWQMAGFVRSMPRDRQLQHLPGSISTHSTFSKLPSGASIFSLRHVMKWRMALKYIRARYFRRTA